LKTPDSFDETQRRYWAEASFRSPLDPVVSAYADPKIEFLNRHVSFSDRRVLEVGCGNGTFTVRLAEKAANVIGVELSPHMLVKNPHKLAVVGTAEGLPFADRSFDIVFAANLLHHVSRPNHVLCELRRCSARFLMLVEPNRWNPLMLGLGLIERAERGTLRSSRRGLLRQLELAGLRTIAVTTTGMISQNRTPGFLVPWLKRFDREMALGEYIVLCAERTA
jgi:SAM-dependent methyltransferase